MKNRLIKFLLTLIGFGGVCGLSSCEYGAIAEYGVPYVRYTAQGTVESKDQSSPIPNIQVIMGYDTAYTDNNGDYRVSVGDYPGTSTYNIEFNDIDSTLNGEYAMQDTTVTFDSSQANGSNANWDNGEVVIEVDMKLIEN